MTPSFALENETTSVRSARLGSKKRPQSSKKMHRQKTTQASNPSSLSQCLHLHRLLACLHPCLLGLSSRPHLPRLRLEHPPSASSLPPPLPSPSPERASKRTKTDDSSYRLIPFYEPQLTRASSTPPAYPIDAKPPAAGSPSHQFERKWPTRKAWDVEAILDISDPLPSNKDREPLYLVLWEECQTTSWEPFSCVFPGCAELLAEFHWSHPEKPCRDPRMGRNGRGVARRKTP